MEGNSCGNRENKKCHEVVENQKFKTSKECNPFKHARQKKNGSILFGITFHKMLNIP